MIRSITGSLVIGAFVGVDDGTLEGVAVGLVVVGDVEGCGVGNGVGCGVGNGVGFGEGTSVGGGVDIVGSGDGGNRLGEVEGDALGRLSAGVEMVGVCE